MEKKKMQRLPDSELQVMRVLWEADGPVPRAYVGERLKGNGWAVTTLNSYLARLMDKGFLSCQRRGQTYYYAPLVHEEAYIEVENESFLERLYGNSLKNLVASFCRTRKMKKEEIDELQALLDRLKQEESGSGYV